VYSILPVLAPWSADGRIETKMTLSRRNHDDSMSAPRKRQDSPNSSSSSSCTTKERLLRWSYRCLLYVFLPAFAFHRLIATLPILASKNSLVKSPTNFTPRTCPPPTYSLQEPNHSSPGKICLTTLTDEVAGSKYQKLVRWRNFDSLLSITWDNKLQYVQQHGCKCV
jgi:hypothetical protein